MVAYAWKRAGRTLALREKFRNQILKATKEQVADAVKTHLIGKKGVVVSFLGANLYQKEKKNLKIDLPLID
jgi:Zn-dependent M16 (insulinase) family peptidase